MAVKETQHKEAKEGAISHILMENTFNNNLVSDIGSGKS